MTAGVSEPKAPVVLGEWTRSATTEPRPACDGPRLLGSSPSDITGRRPLVADILTPPPDNNRQTRRSLRDRWRTEVIRSPHINDGTRVLLLVLADQMREDGYVTVPREKLAQQLDRHERKISARLAEAVEARLLDRVVRGQKGRTAVYRALLRVPGTSTLNGSQGAGNYHPEKSGNRHPDGTLRVPPGGPASTKATTASTWRRTQEPGECTSELPSLKERSAEVDPTPYPADRQEREEGEPTLIGDVIPLLFRRAS